jgi:hypothetical protein
MIELPDVTVVAITTRDYASTMVAIKKTLEQIKPAKVIYFSDLPVNDPDWDNVLIEPLNWPAYNEFVCKELYKYINTSHILLIQHDGYVLNGDVWTDEFLQYDYIGAPWGYTDGRNVGNGGFALRSTKLHKILSIDPNIEIYSPEDEIIGRLYRSYLEKNYQIKFPPEALAHRFSFETQRPWQKTFGFHQHYHQPYREPIVLQRSHAMGDVLMMEPVMEYYHNKGYMVVLDTDPSFMSLFEKHFFPVYHVQQFDSVKGIKTINLNMGYEVKPKQLALKSYYEACGIEDGHVRNPKLNLPVDKQSKLFDKYVVIHSDDTGVESRNVHGLHWGVVADYFEEQGYEVFKVGKGDKRGGIKFNTHTKQMLMWLIAGADFFIGIDSGPSQIAVALGTKSIIFFGSVNPEYRYADLTDVYVLQRPCPVGKDGCYHSVIGVRGVDCEVDKQKPPCISYGDLLPMAIVSNLDLALKYFNR